jgi:hypothetical protein
MKTINLSFILVFTLLIISSTIFASCSSSTGPVDRAPALYGTVKTSKGNPLQGADIYLYFNLRATDKQILNSEDSSITIPNPFSNSLAIKLLAERSSTFMINIIEKAFNDTVFSQSLQLQAGLNFIQDSITANRPGIYEITVNDGTTLIRRKMFYNLTSGYSKLPFAKTDINGNFTIPYDKIPIGYIMQRIYSNSLENGNYEVSDTISVSTGINGMAPLQVVIDTTKAQDVTFTGVK